MALSPIPNPMIWASPQNSHFLSLIRGNPNHLAIKDETSPNLALHRNQTQFVEAQHHGLQELYHRLRLSPNFYPEIANSSAILESAPVAVAAAADHMGFWGSNASWAADLPTANGAYP
ncbi:uncharacterized protein LOC130989956 [Salvia miltiorrhiza]|uniref:uncharacterized protein LOC130989956 n=1 Tax=Salvia miltiorrhiza TaxID=226208 RepID=UPI0025AD8DD4|nr:uncharacterized protein LOC130989956 [Salvia miltiorrhiza]